MDSMDNRDNVGFEEMSIITSLTSGLINVAMLASSLLRKAREY
jgi:hypothetical protein